MKFTYQKYILTIMMGFFLLLMSDSVHANDNKFTRETLKGIKGAKLKININTALKRDGLTPNDILNTAKTKLIDAGFRLYNDQERSTAPGRPQFDIKITGFKVKKKVYAYFITLTIYQDVQLKRTPTVIVSADTWSKNVSGTSSSVADIADMVNIALDMFIKSFKAMNKEEG